MSFTAEITRGLSTDQDLVLVVLLALDATGHGLAPGSVPDLATMASRKALGALARARLTRTSPSGTLELTDAGRAEARAVALRLGGAP